jgi:hypothetical protein
MRNLFIVAVLMAFQIKANAQIVVTLNLPDPCASVTAVPFQSPEAINIAAYPNPVISRLTIELPEAMTSHPTMIELYGMMGERLESFTFSGNREVVIDLTCRPAGLYIISVTSGSAKTHQRIIKL